MIKQGNPLQKQQTAHPSKYPQGHFKPKACKHCDTTFSPKSPCHMYCSQSCADAARADKYYKRTYGISLERYNEMLEEQNHRCAICLGEGFVMKKGHVAKLMVDHCHTTGAVRGLLCHNCNRALGLLQDDRDAIDRAGQYLEGSTTIRKE